MLVVFDELLLLITFQPNESVHRDARSVGDSHPSCFYPDVNVLVLLTIFSPQLNCYLVMPTILFSIAF